MYENMPHRGVGRGGRTRPLGKVWAARAKNLAWCRWLVPEDVWKVAWQWDLATSTVCWNQKRSLSEGMECQWPKHIKKKNCDFLEMLTICQEFLLTHRSLAKIPTRSTMSAIRMAPIRHLWQQWLYRIDRAEATPMMGHSWSLWHTISPAQVGNRGTPWTNTNWRFDFLSL